MSNVFVLDKNKEYHFFINSCLNAKIEFLELNKDYKNQKFVILYNNCTKEDICIKEYNFDGVNNVELKLANKKLNKDAVIKIYLNKNENYSLTALSSDIIVEDEICFDFICLANYAKLINIKKYIIEKQKIKLSGDSSLMLNGAIISSLDLDMHGSAKINSKNKCFVEDLNINTRRKNLIFYSSINNQPIMFTKNATINNINSCYNRIAVRDSLNIEKSYNYKKSDIVFYVTDSCKIKTKEVFKKDLIHCIKIEENVDDFKFLDKIVDQIGLKVLSKIIDLDKLYNSTMNNCQIDDKGYIVNLNEKSSDEDKYCSEIKEIKYILNNNYPFEKINDSNRDVLIYLIKEDKIKNLNEKQKKNLNTLRMLYMQENTSF